MIKQILLRLLLLVLAMPLAAQQGYQIVEKKGKLGLMHQQNQTVVPFNYKYIGEINYPLVIIGKGDFELNADYQLMNVGKRAKLGVYHMEQEREVVPCKYNWVSIKSRTTIVVYKGAFDTEYGYGLKRFYAQESGFGLFNSSGKRLVKCTQNYIDNRMGNAIVVGAFETQKDLWQVNVTIDDNNWQLNAYINEDHAPAPVFNLVDVSGKPFTNEIFSFIGPFSQGLAVACKSWYAECIIEPGNNVYIYDSEGKMGYVDTTGQVVIPFVFDKAQTFKNGKAKVEKGGRKIFIDVNGNKKD